MMSHSTLEFACVQLSEVQFIKPLAVHTKVVAVSLSTSVRLPLFVAGKQWYTLPDCLEVSLLQTRKPSQIAQDIADAACMFDRAQSLQPTA